MRAVRGPYALYARDPTEGASADVFLEHFATAFGSDFLYTRYGAEALQLIPVVRGHTLAGVARVSFTDGHAPTQRLGDLGGEGGVRGLGRGESEGVKGRPRPRASLPGSGVRSRYTRGTSPQACARAGPTAARGFTMVRRGTRIARVRTW